MLTIKEFEMKDLNKAIDFAIAGMNFDQYLDSDWLRRLYGRYFLYLEMNRATDMLAAYDGDQLVGLVMVDLAGEPKPYRKFWQDVYVKCVDWLQKHFVGGVASYNDINQSMLSDFQKSQKTDGELCFLAADSAIKGKGIGSQLMAALADKYPGKRIYLFTDSNCSYQFYDKRGFERVGEREVAMNLGKNQPTTMTCYLYSKVF